MRPVTEWYPGHVSHLERPGVNGTGWGSASTLPQRGVWRCCLGVAAAAAVEGCSPSLGLPPHFQPLLAGAVCGPVLSLRSQLDSLQRDTAPPGPLSMGEEAHRCPAHGVPLLPPPVPPSGGELGPEVTDVPEPPLPGAWWPRAVGTDFRTHPRPPGAGQDSGRAVEMVRRRGVWD